MSGPEEVCPRTDLKNLFLGEASPKSFNIFQIRELMSFSVHREMESWSNKKGTAGATISSQELEKKRSQRWWNWYLKYQLFLDWQLLARKLLGKTSESGLGAVAFSGQHQPASPISTSVNTPPQETQPAISVPANLTRAESGLLFLSWRHPVPQLRVTAPWEHHGGEQHLTKVGADKGPMYILSTVKWGCSPDCAVAAALLGSASVYPSLPPWAPSGLLSPHWSALSVLPVSHRPFSGCPDRKREASSR